MPFYESGDVRIHYEEYGSGFPLLILPGGGLSSWIGRLSKLPFHPVAEFQNEYRCIVTDLRNSPVGESTGPLEVDRPWEAFADDQIGLLNELGVDRFLLMGFCIGGPLIGSLLKRIPARIAGAVVAQPSGFREEEPDYFIKTNTANWGPELHARRGDEITMEMIARFLKHAYGTDPDFVFTVSREFVRRCEVPIFVMPDDTSAHPYQVAKDFYELAPNAEWVDLSWRDAPDGTAEALAKLRPWLHSHAHSQE